MGLGDATDSERHSFRHDLGTTDSRTCRPFGFEFWSLVHTRNELFMDHLKKGRPTARAVVLAASTSRQ